MRNFGTVIQFLSSSKTVTTVLFFVLISGAILTTVFLTGQTQDIRQHAGESKAPNSCQDCKELSIDNVYFCRNSRGQTDCQPKDISTSIPGAVCVDCSIIDAAPKKEASKNAFQIWWETLMNALNPDLNKDGKINLVDLMEVFIKTGGNSRN